VAGPIAPALRALLSNSIDYAGLFPPASLPLDVVVAKYREYKAGEFAWLLGKLVVTRHELAGEPIDEPLTVVSNSDHARAVSIETKLVISTSRPTYCEVPITELDELRKIGSFAKIRAGGVTPEAIPTVDYVANYIEACATRRLPFKATAGLHHPIRSIQPLTYEPGAVRATMHGFINFLLASAFAWHAAPMDLIRNILEETDPNAFRFDAAAHWRDHSLDRDRLTAARRDFAHSFGSCLFTDPIDGLQKLGWL
jgi:hypothetical protein